MSRMDVGVLFPQYKCHQCINRLQFSITISKTVLDLPENDTTFFPIQITADGTTHPATIRLQETP
jgi:hypothetical protein